jgi:CPA2 family monovalent cation:H+ antiporter-2
MPPMHGTHEFLQALATVLCVAAVTTVVFQRLRQPVVLGYVIAGLLVGPHVPFPLVADEKVTLELSELGVILLMFSLGMEFSLRKLAEVGPAAGVTAVVQSSLVAWLGYLAARAFGWTPMECVFTGAILAISSTTIIAKAFDERGIRGRLREFVVGVLVVEDLIAIVLMAIVTSLAKGDGISAGTVVAAGGQLAVFLVLLLAGGMLVVPRGVRLVARLDRPETTLVVAMGLCFACALLAREFGYSVALGAFLAGSLVAESGEEHRVSRLVEPVRDVFAAVFFVSVGMQIEPALVEKHWTAVLALTGVVVLGKVVGVSLGAFLTGNGVRTSVQAGMSLAQIGEFSFIIAGLGLTLRATGEFLYPIAVSVSALTTLTTPWLIRASEPVACAVERWLPGPLQTFAALYGSWIERMRAGPAPGTGSAAVRRQAGLLTLDAVCLGAIVIGVALGSDTLAAGLEDRLGLSPGAARWTVIAGVVAVAAPFTLGVLRLCRGLGRRLAESALPAAAAGKADLAAAPRRVLVVTLQLALVLLVGFPLAVATQPFLPQGAAFIALAFPLAFLGWSFWRSAVDLQGHVRAGSEAIVEALASRAGADPGVTEEHVFDEVNRILPGLGQPVPLQLSPSCAAVGRSLTDLNLRGLTGATVLVIARDGRAIIRDTATEVMRPGDVLALAGTHEAVEAAAALLRGAPSSPPEPVTDGRDS